MQKIRRSLTLSTALILVVTILISIQMSYGDAAGIRLQGTPTATEAQIIVGGDEASLRELFARLITDGVFTGPGTLVYVGGLPDTMPVALPLPKSAQIVGSVISNVNNMTQVFLNTSESPDEVVRFFQESLSSPDWTPPQPGSDAPIVGFVGTPQAQTYFCYQTQKALLRVVAQETGTLTHVDLDLISPADTSVCVGAGAGTAPGIPYTLLPQLYAPKGVNIDPNSGSNLQLGMPAYPSASTAITLSSSLSAAQIADAYNQQIQSAGWTLVGQDTGEKIAWSNWKRKEETQTWALTFIMIATPTQDQYQVQLMIEAAA